MLSDFPVWALGGQKVWGQVEGLGLLVPRGGRGRTIRRQGVARNIEVVRDGWEGGVLIERPLLHSGTVPVRVAEPRAHLVILDLQLMGKMQ